MNTLLTEQSPQSDCDLKIRQITYFRQKKGLFEAKIQIFHTLIPINQLHVQTLKCRYQNSISLFFFANTLAKFSLKLLLIGQKLQIHLAQDLSVCCFVTSPNSQARKSTRMTFRASPQEVCVEPYAHLCSSTATRVPLKIHPSILVA